MPQPSKLLDLLKGAGRALTADVVGGAGDLATDATNLLIGGGGYLGHKLGVIPTEKLPDLLEKRDVPLTSDWFAKNTPLEDTGSEAYSRGRLGAGFAAALAGALPKGTGAQAAGQLNSLFVPESALKTHNLKAASNAVLRVPTGEVLRPVYAPQREAVIDHIRANPGDRVPLTDLYPDLAQVPNFKNASILTKDFPDVPDGKIYGEYRPLTQEIGLNAAAPKSRNQVSAAHEVNHELQSAFNMLSNGGSTANFKGGAYPINAGFGSLYFPGEDLVGFAKNAQSNPYDAYSGLTGEGIARIGGKLQEMFSSGGSQVPTQQLVDAVMRSETQNWANAGITPRLINPTSFDAEQVYLPAHFGRDIINRDGKLYNPAGTRIGYTQSY